MIGLQDRRTMARHIEHAHAKGARLAAACAVAGISVRTLQRWQAQEGLQKGDGRPQALRPTPGHALTREERQRLLEVANEPRFADMPPARIVPMLADEGVYLASESTFSRVLREQGHEVRLMSPEYVQPYVKAQKNDDRDAEAIAEAATRPMMRFVPLKAEVGLPRFRGHLC